jgi:phosphoribosyl-ATP pyrophosphohydrolase
MSVFTQKIDRIILEEGIETVTKKINDDIAEEREDLVYPKLKPVDTLKTTIGPSAV